MPIVLIVIKFDLRELFACHEYLFSEFLEAPRQCDALKLLAGGECLIVYLMYTFRDRYFPESVAIFECLGTDMLKSLFDDQFFESDAAEEGFTAYAFYTFSDRKLAQARAGFEYL